MAPGKAGQPVQVVTRHTAQHVDSLSHEFAIWEIFTRVMWYRDGIKLHHVNIHVASHEATFPIAA